MARRSTAILLFAMVVSAGGCDAFEDARTVAAKAARAQAKEEIERAVADTVRSALETDGLLPASIGEASADE